MRLREAAGHINRADVIRVYVRYAEDPEGSFYLPVTRVQAKTIIDHARSQGVEEIDVEVTRKGIVFIGEEIELLPENE